MIPSKAKFTKFLFDACVPGDVIDNIGYETYGKETYAYIGCQTVNNRKNLTRKMRREGYLVNEDYMPEGTTVEVRVRYFKARGWDE